jgi:hypothetical protein
VGQAAHECRAKANRLHVSHANKPQVATSFTPALPGRALQVPAIVDLEGCDKGYTDQSPIQPGSEKEEN